MNRADIQKQIDALQDELNELKKSIPAHSMRVGMMNRIEEIEEEIAEKKKNL